MIEEAHQEFKKNNPEVKLTYKNKAHGKIVYVDGATAYNMDDMYSFKTYNEQYEALEKALVRSRLV